MNESMNEDTVFCSSKRKVFIVCITEISIRCGLHCTALHCTTLYCTVLIIFPTYSRGLGNK